uniref:Enolase C-terminal domain-containing protein n=2 Tax=Nelumbo nucifera TaxID=4432 RepID=A0A822YB30_NELNU|nr:TPA_asm: hypothetical protein HUJ06_031105 [Nelumbo nucifera]
MLYMQIPIVSPSKAFELASMYYKQGFNTLKLKVGKNLNADIEVLKAIRLAHPDCMFILDANEGYTANEAIQVLEKLCGKGVSALYGMYEHLCMLRFRDFLSWLSETFKNKTELWIHCLHLL